jgi:hypothetical protein
LKNKAIIVFFLTPSAYSSANNTVRGSNTLSQCKVSATVLRCFKNRKISVRAADMFSSEGNGHSASQEIVKQCNYLRNDE